MGADEAVSYCPEVNQLFVLKGGYQMSIIKFSMYNCVYENYYPPDNNMYLKCKIKGVNSATSGGYMLSTENVDNSVDTVDKFQKCHI